MKPLGIKSYGSIPHLIGSRLGEGDHHAHEGQVRICTEKPRDKHDLIIVQEKLDGGNVGVCKVNGEILAITRAGYLAETSPYKTHHAFKEWVNRNKGRFNCLLHENERVCGEWLLTSVGTRYKLQHEPFVPFDLIMGKERSSFNEFTDRINAFDFTPPKLLSIGKPVSISLALDLIEVSGHGATEPTEGAIWRVERKGKVDFLCKYVRPDKVDGKYLETSPANILPNGYDYLLKFL